jgi:CheY-like chemotaxis protein
MPKKILLADDSITIQKVVELTFSDADYEVVTANNGARAIDRLAEVRPAIVLSDIIMPEKNGYEVCEYIKSHPEFRHIPVILLTGTFEPFDPERAERAGCDAVVTKPFESQSLIHKVEELIGQSAPAITSDEFAPAAPLADDVPETSQWPVAGNASSPFDEPAAAPAGETYTSESASFEASPFETDADEELSWSAPASPAEEPPAGSPLEAPPRATEPMFETRGDELFPQGDQVTGEPAAAEDFDFGAETSVFPKASYEDFAAPAEPAPLDEQPHEAPQGAADDAFAPPAAPDAGIPEPARAEYAPQEEEESLYGRETRAFPKMTLDDFGTASQATPEWQAAEDEEAPLAAAESGPVEQPQPEPPAESWRRSEAEVDREELRARSPWDFPADEPPPADAAASAPAPEPSWSRPDDEAAAGQPREESLPWERTSEAEPAPTPWEREASEPAWNSEEAATGSAWQSGETPSAEPQSERPYGLTTESWAPPEEEPVPSAETGGLAEPSSPSDERGFETEEPDYPAGEAETFAPSSEEEVAFEEPEPAGESAIVSPAAADESPWDLPREEPRDEFAPAEAEPPAEAEAPFAAGSGVAELAAEQPHAPAAEQEPEIVSDEPAGITGAASFAEPSLYTEPAYEAPAYEEPAEFASAAPLDAGSEMVDETPALIESVALPAQAELDLAALTDEQVERIARRVVEMLSDSAIRDIAWEVIPDMAEMIVKERIRELESEE